MMDSRSRRLLLSAIFAVLVVGGCLGAPGPEKGGGTSPPPPGSGTPASTSQPDTPTEPAEPKRSNLTRVERFDGWIQCAFGFPHDGHLFGAPTFSGLPQTTPCVYPNLTTAVVRNTHQFHGRSEPTVLIIQAEWNGTAKIGDLDLFLCFEMEYDRPDYYELPCMQEPKKSPFRGLIMGPGTWIADHKYKVGLEVYSGNRVDLARPVRWVEDVRLTIFVTQCWKDDGAAPDLPADFDTAWWNETCVPALPMPLYTP